MGERDSNRERSVDDKEGLDLVCCVSKDLEILLNLKSGWGEQRTFRKMAAK